MISRNDVARSFGMLLCAALFGLQNTESALAQSNWRPEKAVEIIVPTGAGGANDLMARLIQKTLQDTSLVPTPLVVMNKPGGNQTLATVYLRQNARDPHYLLYSTSNVFTAEITGRTAQRYTDLAPIALLMTEYSVIAVKPDSPIRNLRDLVAQLKANPQSLAFGIVSHGGSNHIALSQVAKTTGMDPRQLKVVVFKTNVESYLGVAGGHIHAVASSSTAALPFVQQGTVRILAIGAPQRQQGPLAQVPTFIEEGVDVPLTTNWRGVFGAPGISQSQAAYWDNVITKMAATEEWRKNVDPHGTGRIFLSGGDFRKFLASEYEVSKTVLGSLGYAKQKP